MRATHPLPHSRFPLRTLHLGLAMATGLAVAPLRDARADATTLPGAERKPAAEFALPTLDGKRVKLADTHGKVVLISFWASWCGPCKQELPILDALAKKYAEQGLVVWSINTDAPKTAADVKRIVAQKGVSLPILMDSEGAVAAKLDPANAMPFTLYLDRAGRVAHTHEGFQPGDEADIEARVQALLAEKP